MSSSKETRRSTLDRSSVDNDGGKKGMRQASPRVFRVTRLPPEDMAKVEKKLINIIRKNMETSEENIQISAQCVPSCEGDGLNALVEFMPKSPIFLREAEKKPLEPFDLNMGNDDISFDTNFFGFTQLYPTKEPISLDVIAITGLAGHAYGSWRGRGNLRRMWLRHFFSKDFPNCRTMTYGYDTSPSARSIGTILDYGRAFLEDLKGIRNTEESRKRPIVFIAHSFGGIILAHSLIRASMTNERDDPVLRYLPKSTYAIMFFGTPHKGLVIRDLQNMVPSQSPRHQLLAQIEQMSDILQAQLSDFRNIARQFKIISFYEINQTRETVKNPETEHWERTGQYVTKVNTDSALLGLSDDMEVKVPVNADHSDMVKFVNASDRSYKVICRYLKEFEKDAGPVVAQRTLMY